MRPTIQCLVQFLSHGVTINSELSPTVSHRRSSTPTLRQDAQGGYDKLLRFYILQTPKSRNYAPVQSGPIKELTLEDLESRTHTILEDSVDASGDMLVRIPYFFLYIYNHATDVVRN
ncbi:hypothetical protein BGZ59_007888 [Podila verticillata]|nr:hypothetical protein BGZ59_007888 [Podila verticillata]